jgi:hypothetical protein
VSRYRRSAARSRSWSLTIGAVRLRYPGRAAERADRGRQVASGRAGEPDGSLSGNASPVTCSAAAAPWPTLMAQPQGLVDRRRPAPGQAVETARGDARPLRPDTGGRRRLGREGAAPAAADRARAVRDRRRLADFYDAAIERRCPRSPGWPKPSRHVASDPGRAHHDASNARTEGFNRVIKQTNRVGCGYRNMINY